MHMSIEESPPLGRSCIRKYGRCDVQCRDGREHICVVLSDIKSYSQLMHADSPGDALKPV